MDIHPTAIVHPRAQVAPGVKIGPYCVVGENVQIGKDTLLDSHVVAEGWTTIGERCHLFPFVSVGTAPQAVRYRGEPTRLTIGSDNLIREFVTIHRGTKDRWKTSVGKNCLIMAYSHLAHDCLIGDNCIMSNNTQIAGHVTIGDYAILAGMCAVHQFVKIGKYAFVAGGSLVSKDVPPYIKAGRQPLSYAGVNSIGLKRKGFSVEKINHILDIYRYIYNKGMNTTQAVQYIEEEFAATDERDEIVTFIRESGRGIIKRFSKNNTDEDLTD